MSRKRSFDLVEEALKNWPATRDSDRKLCMTVWWLQDNDFLADFKQFFLSRAIMPETITRARRKLQEEGKYPPSKAVEEVRYSKYVQSKQEGMFYG